MGKDLKGKELGTGISQRKDGIYIGRFTNRFGKRVILYNKNLKQLKTDMNVAIYDDTTCNNVIDNKMKLDNWYEQWMEVHKYNIIRENSKRHYNNVYYKHISPELGKYKLSEITQLQIKALIKKLDKQGLQFETQNKVRIMLLDMYNKAMIDEFVNKNPAKGITVKRKDDIDRKVLTVEEQKLFFDCCKGTFYDNLFTVAVSSGLRMGELAALRISDIDFENKNISVLRTLVYQKLDGDTNKEFHFFPPKTKTSIRKVPMNSICEQALRKQILQKNVISSREIKKVDEQFKDLLFTTRFNTPLNCQNFSDAIRKIIDEINLMRDDIEQIEYFSSHTFRHTFATRCFEAGIEPKTVQSYLGHATLQMTMDLYTHVLGKHQSNEMSKLEKVLDIALGNDDNSIGIAL